MSSQSKGKTTIIRDLQVYFPFSVGLLSNLDNEKKGKVR